MLSTKDFETRANALFESCRDRWKKKLEKGLPKNVALNIAPEDVLPFTRREFQQWLWKAIGLQAISCPYCRAAMDVLSMQLDHKVPLRRGGSMAFENRECLCTRCNQVKGELTRDEFLLLVAFMEGPGAHFRQRLEGTLISGGLGKVMKHFPRGKAKQTAIQPGLDLSGLGAF